MGRLTIRTPSGAALKMEDHYPNEDAARHDLMVRYRAAMEKLAAYEDTCLEPYQVVQRLETLRLYQFKGRGWRNG